MTREIERLRKQQLSAAAPHIGPLLDAWDQLSNDQRTSIEKDAPAFAACLSALEGAWMDDGSALTGNQETDGAA